MTIIKKAKSRLQKGDETVVDEMKYYEVGGAELNTLLIKVAQGGEEKELRENLIKTSKWGENGR